MREANLRKSEDEKVSEEDCLQRNLLESYLLADDGSSVVVSHADEGQGGGKGKEEEREESGRSALLARDIEDWRREVLDIDRRVL